MRLRRTCLVLVAELFCGLALAQRTPPRIALFKPTLDARTQARVQVMLSQIQTMPALVDLESDWNSYSLVVLVDPPIPSTRRRVELDFSQKIATFYLVGGHVLFIGVPGRGKYPASAGDETWNKLMHYFFNAGLWEMNGALEDSDHRALFVSGIDDLGPLPQFAKTISRLLQSQDQLPAAVSAADFGSAPHVELRGNSLWVGNQPRLLKSVGPYFLEAVTPAGEPEATLRRFHEFGFNAIVVSVRDSASDEQIRGFLDTAHRNQMYAQFRLHGPFGPNGPVRKEYLLRLLRFRNHPALIGWITGDDMWDVYYPYVQQEIAIVRKYDQRKLPITSTFMNLRQPEQVEDWHKWTSLMDFPLAYIYPMQRDLATLGIKGEIGGGLKDIDRLAANARKVFGERFAEQYLQAHMQGPFATRVGLKDWSEHLVPTSEQERLIVYHALLNGLKGMILYFPASLEDGGMGRGRRNEVGIVWNEVAPIEGILAAGATPESLATSDSTVDASWIRSGNEAAIVVVKDEPYYNRYIDHAAVEALTVHLPSDASDCTVYQLGWPRPAKLEVRHGGRERSVVLHSFHLTALLISTCDSNRQRELQEMADRSLPRTARYAADVLGDETAKTNTVAAHVPTDLLGDSALLRKARAALDSAQKGLAAQDWIAAWQQARAGISFIEEFRSDSLKVATADAERHSAPAAARVYLNLFFSLPNYVFVTRGGRPIEPGQLQAEIRSLEANP
ncbi:MAG TPA: hypothetical protein VG675_24810 [Bryobacteraceae bacterium]|nr:hypothetical protein [Bryobacteraceae bacterium]